MLFKGFPSGKLFFFVLLYKKAVMRIDIITLFPELLQSPFEASIVKRALQAGRQKFTFTTPAITAE